MFDARSSYIHFSTMLALCAILLKLRFEHKSIRYFVKVLNSKKIGDYKVPFPGKFTDIPNLQESLEFSMQNILLDH